MNTERNKSDVYCKKALRIRSVAAYVLKDILKEYEQYTYQEVLESLNRTNDFDVLHLLNSEDISKDNAKVFYDLLSNVDINGEKILINLEPQGRIGQLDTLIKRSIYVSSRMIAWQRNEPEGFYGNDFDNLKKTVSIWIVLNPPKNLEGKQIVIDDECSDERLNEGYVSHMRRIVLMFLHRNINVKDKSALMMLSVLFGKQITQKQQLFILKEEYGIVMTKEDERTMDELYGTADAFYERGEEAGFARGKSEGKIEGKLEVAEKLLKKKESVEAISELLDLPVGQIHKISERLVEFNGSK